VWLLLCEREGEKRLGLWLLLLLCEKEVEDERRRAGGRRIVVLDVLKLDKSNCAGCVEVGQTDSSIRYRT
jgi:hypothetical protein